MKLNIELVEKNEIIEKLIKEIEGYKNNNNKFLQENAELKEHIQILENEQDDELLNTVDNLKEEINDKNLQIEKLIEENNSLRNNNKDRLFNSEKDGEKEMDLNNNKEINPFRNSLKINDLDETDKIKFYKEENKQLKLINESDQIQIKALKEDIKDLKKAIKNMQTFNGQLKDFNEFLSLLNKAIENYKPKKLEQKDAFNKVIEVINNFLKKQ